LKITLPFLSWKLWRTLPLPMTGHPLYRQVVTEVGYIMPWPVACGVIVIAPLLIPVMLFFSSAVYGLRYALEVSTHLAREREGGVYDLLATTPAGAFGISRIIVSACLNRNESLEQLNSGGAWILRGFMALSVMLLFASFMLPTIPDPDNSPWNRVVIPLYVGMMGVAIYVDHVHSIMLGALVGMLAPNFMLRRLDAGGAAVLAFLFLQVVTYLLTVVIGFVVVPGIMDALLEPTVTRLLLPVVRIVIFFGIREWMIGVLWQRLVRETQAAPSELEFMTGRP
jgi:hypothetical protein